MYKNALVTKHLDSVKMRKFFEINIDMNKNDRRKNNGLWLSINGRKN